MVKKFSVVGGRVVCWKQIYSSSLVQNLDKDLNEDQNQTEQCSYKKKLIPLYCWHLNRTDNP